MRQTKEKSKEKLKIKKLPLKQPPPNKLSPLDRHYHVSSLNHPVSKEFNQLCAQSLPFGNELIKHNPREEQDAMHEIKIRVLHKAYKQVFKQLCTQLCQNLQNKSASSQKDHNRITSK
jgi:hypothetical protein